jgi:F-type H+-transporting ATPase subunit alpha
VSRVGGKTQAPALRQDTGTLRLDYAQYLELEMFTRFGGLSDVRVKAQMERGARARALLIQPRFTPLRLADEVALAFALREGLLDAVPVESIAALRETLPAWLDEKAGDFVRVIQRTSRTDEADLTGLRQTLSELVQQHAVVA